MYRSVFMGRNTKWTDELKNEMVKFFTEAEKAGNKSVRENSEAFAQNYDNLTASQVKTAYYKFCENANKTSDGNNNSARWSKKENNELLNAVKNKNGTLTNVFESFAKTHNRTSQNVSQHYYFLMRQENKQNNNTTNKKSNQNNKTQNNQWTKRSRADLIERLNKSIKRLPIETIENLQSIVNAINKKA